MIVAFTGHRPDKLGGWDPNNSTALRVQQVLRDALAATPPLYGICGMALGVDTWAAEACAALGVPFIAALPCDDMEAVWPRAAQLRYRALLARAREVVTVAPGPYRPWKMQRRNVWMVDHCTHLWAVHDGSRGGTYNCLTYAVSAGQEVVQLPWQAAQSTAAP